MRRWMHVMAAALATAALLLAVTVNGSLHVLGTLTAVNVDFGSAQATAPMQTGTSLPSGCAIGQAFFKTDAAAGQNIYLCTAANTWTPVQGGSGASFDRRPDTRYVVSMADFLGVPYDRNVWFENGWMFTKVSGANNINNPVPTIVDALDPGVMQLGTSSTSGDDIRFESVVGLPDASQNGLYSRTTVPWEIKVRFRLPQASDASNSRMLILLGSGSENPPMSVGLRYLGGTDTTLKLYSAGSANVYGTVVDTGVVPGTDWHVWKVRSDGAAAYRFYMSVDESAESSVCESGCTFNMNGPYFDDIFRKLQFSMRTNEAAGKRLQIDYVSLYMDRGVRR
ncbi:MAG: hypothetical protein WHT08_14555 [Bryobacteraceae bacterium]